MPVRRVGKLLKFTFDALISFSFYLSRIYKIDRLLKNRLTALTALETSCFVGSRKNRAADTVMTTKLAGQSFW